MQWFSGYKIWQLLLKYKYIVVKFSSHFNVYYANTDSECYIVCLCMFVGLEQLKDREYLGTCHSIKLNSDYAAAHFEDKIQLHMVCTDDTYVWC